MSSESLSAKNQSKVRIAVIAKFSWYLDDAKRYFSETESRRLRRSLYIVEDVKIGDVISGENLRAIRPNGGCPPKFLPSLLGKKFRSDYSRGTPMDINFAIE